MRAAALLAFAVLAAAIFSASQTPPPAAPALAAPAVVRAEHAALHAELQQLTQAGGRTGSAARNMAKVLDPHFAQENAYALPPLGLLRPLAQGQFDCSMAAVLPLTGKLATRMPQMLAEHQRIEQALATLADAAKAENNAAGVRFAERLREHAETEEQVTYPAALLVGRYVQQMVTAHCAHATKNQ